jgi:hypothetical protein
MGHARQLGQWRIDRGRATRAARRARRCAAARARLAEALAQLAALQQLEQAAGADPTCSWLAQQLAVRAEVASAAARAEMQRSCGALLVTQPTPVTLTTHAGPPR